MNAIKNQEALLKLVVAQYKKACAELQAFNGNLDSDKYCELLDNRTVTEKAVIQAGLEFAAFSPKFKSAKTMIEQAVVKAERNIVVRRQLAQMFVNTVSQFKGR